MRKNIALIILAVSLVPLVGCAKKQVKAEEPVIAADSPSETGVPADAYQKEVADQEVRDAILALQRVHFELESTELNQVSQEALMEAAEKLKSRPAVNLHVQGHADTQGATEFNLQLGENRATVVRDYLARLGVAPERLYIISYGEEEPMAAGDTAEAHAQNRRVDFRLMKGDVELVLESPASPSTM